MTPPPDIPRTGERFVPGQEGETALEHLHRYVLATRLAPDKRVLDIACGEGYGANLLAAAGAHEVTGIDIDETALRHARARYLHPALRFLRGNGVALPLSDGSVDLAVSFETLEHLADHDAMLAELRRVLAPGGLLLLSTPDKRHYSDVRAYRNPFHVKELYEDEFRTLIQRHFPHVALYGQGVVHGSLINGTGSFKAFSGQAEAVLGHDGIPAPLYWLALASDAPLPVLPPTLFDGTAWFQGEMLTMNRALADANDQLARTRLELAALRASVYWRITAPLRFAARSLRYLLRRGGRA